MYGTLLIQKLAGVFRCIINFALYLLTAPSKKQPHCCSFVKRLFLRFSTASFAYRHFQFHYLNNCFLFVFGTKNGKLMITVSSFTFVRVSQVQIGQESHRESFACSSIFTSPNYALPSTSSYAYFSSRILLFHQFMHNCDFFFLKSKSPLYGTQAIPYKGDLMYRCCWAYLSP